MQQRIDFGQDNNVMHIPNEHKSRPKHSFRTKRRLHEIEIIENEDDDKIDIIPKKRKLSISNTKDIECMTDLNKTKTDKIEIIDINIDRKPKVTKLSINSISGILVICIGTTMYGIIGILARLSMCDDFNNFCYDPNAALVLAECGKFTISFILLFYFEGISGLITSIRSVPFIEWFLFLIPAIIYSITNNLTWWILQYMDPGSMSILLQTKIITTAILWWYWFQKTLNKQQWISLMLLCLGSMLVVWPWGNKQNAMYVVWPWGPSLLLIQVCLSAIAGIYTEFVYKTYGKKRSMHIDNLSMYFWGSAANIIQFYYNHNNTALLLNGFNVYTYLLIIVYILMGLSVAYVMKYFSNIIKLFMGGFSIILSSILTFIIFGLIWTPTYCIGLFVVVSSITLYKTKKCI